MADLDLLVSDLVLAHVDDSERSYLSEVFRRCGGFPSLQQLWQLMDEPWIDLGCDPSCFDNRIISYYKHPVWLLNGLFIEQDPQSLSHRHTFTEWVVANRPTRVADYGGGFGGLARLIGEALPDTCVEIVEPHPHPAAIALADTTPNVRYVTELVGSYDLLIATDVFEHVPDPIGLVSSTSAHLRPGGFYLIANCFSPVIKCHLPQLFPLSIGWEQIMIALGFIPRQRIVYGRAYQYVASSNKTALRRIEKLIRLIYPMLKPIPIGRVSAGRALMRLLGPFLRR